MSASETRGTPGGARLLRNQDSTGRIVLCAGLKSSGSTWLYNAVVQLCESGFRRGSKNGGARRVLPFYADRLEDFPPGADSAGLLIVKSHVPSPALAFLTSFAGGTTFVTVREPRDSIASLMKRFGHEFETSLQEVGRSAGRLVELSGVGRPTILRYEDGFFRKPTTMARLCAQIGVALPPAALDRIYQSLTATNVKREIATLAKSGAFGLCGHPDSFDAKTHWHPGHIGDERIGKYADILSPQMQRQVLRATADYCNRFGYPRAVRAPRRRREPSVALAAIKE
jgi:hypothetical protein